MTVMTTWTSLRRPLAKVGRSGRSIRRQVRIASSRRPALAAEERAGDAPGGVHPLLDVDGEREEVELLLGLTAGRGGRQQHGVAVGDDDGAGGLAREPAGLEGDGAAAEAAVVDDRGGGGDAVLGVELRGDGAGGGCGHVSFSLLVASASCRPATPLAASRQGYCRPASGATGARSKPSGIVWSGARGPLPRTGPRGTRPAAGRCCPCGGCRTRKGTDPGMSRERPPRRTSGAGRVAR